VVDLSDASGREELLEALDETPQTTERLARRLDADPDRLDDELHRAAEEGQVADWGTVWATTWRAKLSLQPRFFRIWIPASVALGAGLTALALALNAPAPFGVQAALGVLGLAIVAAIAAAYGWARDA
jgi:hypothetical protein